MRCIARRERLRLEYDASLVPEGGPEVCQPAAAPVKHKNKDAAGHIFHEWALKQSGVLGAARAVDTCAVDERPSPTLCNCPHSAAHMACMRLCSVCARGCCVRQDLPTSSTPGWVCCLHVQPGCAVAPANSAGIGLWPVLIAQERSEGSAVGRQRPRRMRRRRTSAAVARRPCRAATRAARAWMWMTSRLPGALRLAGRGPPGGSGGTGKHARRRRSRARAKLFLRLTAPAPRLCAAVI